jgi:hypothetical protein
MPFNLLKHISMHCEDVWRSFYTCWCLLGTYCRARLKLWKSLWLSNMQKYLRCVPLGNNWINIAAVALGVYVNVWRYAGIWWMCCVFFRGLLCSHWQIVNLSDTMIVYVQHGIGGVFEKLIIIIVIITILIINIMSSSLSCTNCVIYKMCKKQTVTCSVSWIVI